MAATLTRIVRVLRAKNLHYGVPAEHVRTFDDGTALVRFAAGNILIVPMELLEPATEAQAREYYAMSAA